MRGLHGREACLMPSSKIAAHMELSFFLHRCLSNPTAYPLASFSPKTRSPAASLVSPSRPGAVPRLTAPKKRAGGTKGARLRAVVMFQYGHGIAGTHGGSRRVPECVVPPSHHRPGLRGRLQGRGKKQKASAAPE